MSQEFQAFGPRALGGFVLALLLGSTSAAIAEDWPHWRGPQHTGVSEATGLITSWSTEGENLLWRRDFIGRSTPVILGGRVFVMGRGGDQQDRRELVAAFDAKTGDPLWEHTVPNSNTTVPYNRAGWASLAADVETGYLYAQGVGGRFFCLDADGNVVWQRNLTEELGRFNGYGGRTHTPLVDEDQVIVSVINGSWGPLGRPTHRYYAFDKKTGAIRWMAQPGGLPYDRNTTSNGQVAVINGQRLFISGNADGHIYALKARTGELVWEFELSKRGINSSPLVIGDTVYIGHSEENIDEATLGRTVAIDATGTGDVTKTHERWRQPIKMGFPSPMFHEGRLYVVDNSANLSALNVETGEVIWHVETGTVGKNAPVWADGKIYVTEVNGNVTILEPSDTGAEVLDRDEVKMPDGRRYAETYGSPAIAYGRIYFTTEEGIYCLGDADASFDVASSPPRTFREESAGSNDPAVLRVVPGDVTVMAGETVDYQVLAFNETGRSLGAVDAELSFPGGSFDGSTLRAPAEGFHAAEVTAKSGSLEAKARVRVFPPLPYEESFDDIQGRGRPYWIGAGRYQVADLDGAKVLEKPVAERGLLRSKLFMGPPSLTEYTVEAEIRGSLKGRRKTDGGLINSGYILDLLGNSQKLEIRTWTAVRRIATAIDFAWDMDKWYQLKFSVERTDGKAIAKGKVWAKGEPEPSDWTLVVEDPLPVPAGAPGLQAYSPASFYFDNVKIYPNP